MPGTAGAVQGLELTGTGAARVQVHASMDGGGALQRGVSQPPAAVCTVVPPSGPSGSAVGIASVPHCTCGPAGSLAWPPAPAAGNLCNQHGATTLAMAFGLGAELATVVAAASRCACCSTGQLPEWGVGALGCDAPAEQNPAIGSSSRSAVPRGACEAAVGGAGHQEGPSHTGGGNSSCSSKSSAEVAEAGDRCGSPPPPPRRSRGRPRSRKGSGSGETAPRAGSAAVLGAGSSRTAARPGRPRSAPAGTTNLHLELGWLEENGYFDMPILVRRKP